MSYIYDDITSDLDIFSEIDIDRELLRECIHNKNIKAVNMFVLGPDGTNIYLAAQKWAKVNGIEEKVIYTLCKSPQVAVSSAKEVMEKGVLPIFVLCAVYYKLYDLYFSNKDCLFFMDHIYMKLDNMQLAANYIEKREKYKVFCHPSPSRLISHVDSIEVAYSNSNSYAAQECKSKDGTLCITTESARKLYGLRKIHSFGSPVMLFTFGTTAFGIELLKSCSLD